ncbi:MAG: 30S ribosomal protein S4e [Nanoarchaeota archaeon]
MKHLKRQMVPKNWPVPRKGTTFVVRPISGKIPILVVLRNILKIAQNRKEVKKSLHANNILINGKAVKEDKIGVSLFDVVTIVPSKKNYRIELKQNGKFKIEEVDEKEANKKISKIVNKKILKGKKIQLNLNDGNNILSDIKCDTNDSVILDLKTKKIIKCLELKEKANVVIFAGKHAGKKGVIEKLKLERKMASVKSGEDKINVLIKQLVVIE